MSEHDRKHVAAKSFDETIVEEIADLIACPPETSRVITFTPAAAAVIVQKYNQHNRQQKPGKIAEYAHDMANGLWKLTGDTIKFSDRGLLRDGQNRLLACVAAGVPFVSHVVFGIEDGAFWWMDRGKLRDASDGLTIAGWKDAKVVAAAARWIRLFQLKAVKTRRVFSPPEVKEISENLDAKLLQDAARAGRRVYDYDRLPAGICAALFYVFSEADADLAKDFFGAWTSGQTTGRFSPLGRCLKIIRDLQKAQTGRLHEVVRLSLIVQAWNYCCREEKPSMGDFVTDITARAFPRVERPS